MKNSIFIFFVFISQFLFSQNGFNVKINLKNINEEKLYLSFYNGSLSKTAVVDSASIIGKNTVIFTQKKKIIDAVYRLSFKKNEKQNYVNIDLENNSDLVFDLDNNILRSIKTTNPLNKAFLDAQNIINRSERKIYLETIVQKFPNSAAALYAKLEIKELSLPTDEIQLKIYRDHFFTDLDLNDKRIKLLPNIYSSLYNYVKLLPFTNENYKSSIDNLLRNQTCKSPNYLFYLKWVFQNLEYLSKNNLNDSYNYVFNTYLNSEECMKKDEQFYQSIVLKLKQNEKLPLGSIVPDLALTNIEGKDITFNSIFSKHDYTMVIFFDPDCSHCQEKMPEIVKYFNENKFSKDIMVLGFLNTTNDTKWKKFVEDYQMQNWLNVKSKDNNDKYQENLGVFANPNYLLLNRKGEVVLKNYNTDEFKKIFQ